MLQLSMPNHDPIELDLPTGGKLLLRVLTVRDNGEIDKWVFEEISPRELALRILGQQVVAPESIDLDGFSDLDLALFVSRWLHADDGDAWPDNSIGDLSTLQTRLRDHYQRERDKLRAISVRIIGTDTFRHIAELQTQLAKSLAPLSATLSNIRPQ